MMKTGLLLLGLFVLASKGTASAVQVDGREAGVSISWESMNETAWIWLTLEEGDATDFQASFEKTFGCKPDEDSAHSPEALWVECPGVAVHEGLTLHTELDLTSLAQSLREGGIRFLSITLNHRSLMFTRIEGLADSYETKGWGGGHTIYYNVDLETSNLGRIALEMGYSKQITALGVVLMTGVLLLPFVVAIRHRIKLLRGDTRALDEASWFSHWRFFHWLTLGTFFAWIVLYVSFSIWGMLGLLLNNLAGVGQNVVRLTVLLLPPFLSLGLYQIISVPVLDHLRGTKGIGRRIVRASLMGAGMVILPVLFALIGVLTMLQDLRMGLVWMAAAVLTRFVLAGLLTRDEDFAPHAVTVGELRDRVFDLAHRFGVKVRQLYVFPAKEVRMANAFAVQGGNVILTDFLLEKLNKKEVDGIVAHELAHLRHHHPLLLVICLFIPVFIVTIGYFGAGAFLNQYGLALLPAELGWMMGAAAGLMFFFFMARRFELSADADAVLLTHEHEAMISGLAKLTQANLFPREWGGWLKWFITHPSLEERANAIAVRARLAPDRVQELIESGLEDQPTYARLTSSSEARIFSTTFKMKTITRIGLAMVGVIVLAPAIVALVIDILGWEGVFRGAAYVFGVGLCFGIIFFTSDRISTWGYRELRHRLSLKLSGEGVDLEGGVFVNFAPDREPRLYENYTGWDVGFVLLNRDRLAYMGDQARFAIRREMVSRVTLEKGFPSWSRPLQACIEYKENEQTEDRPLSFTVFETNSICASRYPTAKLVKRIKIWKEGSEPPQGSLPLPEGLRLPNIGEVTSEPARSAVRPSRVIQTLIFVSVSAFLASMLLGLSFSLWNGGAWYSLMMSILSVGFQLLPVGLYRERK